MISFGTQSFLFIGNHELTKQFSLEIKNLISWGVFCKDYGLWQDAVLHLCSTACII